MHRDLIHGTKKLWPGISNPRHTIEIIIIVTQHGPCLPFVNQLIDRVFELLKAVVIIHHIRLHFLVGGGLYSP